METAALLAPAAVALVLGICSRRIGTTLPPAASVATLSAAALITALSTGVALALVGANALAQFPPIERWGGWSAAALDSTEPVPDWLAVLAGVVAVALLATVARQVTRAVRQLREASRLCHELGADVEGLVVTDDERADAFAVSGLGIGRIVVSRSMLRALAPAERRVLLAHEAAHLRRRHHAYVLAVDLAAAANPLLRPVAREVRVGVERWADEIAAAETGDRALVARALARAGLARMASGSGARAAGLSATEVDLQRRMHALMDDRPRPRPLLIAVVALLALAVVGANAVVAQETRERLAYAESISDHR